MSTESKTIVFPVDRSRAFMRGIWRLACGVPLLCAAALFWPDFGLLWLSDRATAVGLGVLFVAALAAGIMLSGSALRWFALSLWPGDPQIAISAAQINLALGPFGRQSIPWSHIRVELTDVVDPEILEQMPDDAVLPILRHAPTGQDLTGVILLFTLTSSEQCARALRPYWFLLLRDRGLPT